MEKRSRDIFLVVILVLVLIGVVVGVVYFVFGDMSHIVSKARGFCGDENVAGVSICNGVIVEVKSASLGGGSTYYHEDGTTFSCPVVAPASMSSDCKAIFNAEQGGQWNCERVC